MNGYKILDMHNDIYTNGKNSKKVTKRMYTDWPLAFIGESDFIRHVRMSLEEYGKTLKPVGADTVDLINLVYDSMAHFSTWEGFVRNEIFRQRDKSNNNDIGYFHQYIFRYIKNCVVPANGQQGGWDVIYRNPDGIRMPEGDVVHTVYVEMKNKHNTMNSSSSADTYISMQNQLLTDDDCVCMLVEAIAKHSQNIKWKVSVNRKKVEHRRIRRVSMDKFYALVTGIDDAFYQMCLVLPDVIEKVIENAEIAIPVDTAFSEIRNMANQRNISIAMAFYLLGFSEYDGFTNL